MRKFNQTADTSMSKKSKLRDTNTNNTIVISSVNAEEKSYMIRSASKLFDALESFNKLGTKRKCENFVIFEAEHSSTYSVRICNEKVVKMVLSNDIGHNQSTNNSLGSKKRHVISGTGRVAFSGKSATTTDFGKLIGNSAAEEDSVRMIYRMTKDAKAPEDSMPWTEFTLGGSPSAAAQQLVDGALSAAVSGVMDATATSNLAGSFTSLSVDSGSSGIPVPIVAVNKFTGKPIVANKQGGGGSSISNMFKKSASASGGGALRAPLGVFNKASSSSAGNSNGGAKQQLGVGVGGRAAAMARMAVLGEEWPEEEELPGAFTMASSNVTTSGSAATAGVSKEVGKEVHIAHQRAQKIKAAKRG